MRPKIILDTRKIITQGENSGKHHIKIKVSIPVFENGVKVWKPKRAKTFYYATQAEFNAMPKTKVKSLQDKWDKVNEYLRKAKDVCKLAGLTPDQYIRYMEGKGSFENITGMFDWYIGECLKEDKDTGEARDGNAIVLKNAKSFFIRYKGGTHISYAEITKEWLEDCRTWATTEIKDAEGKVTKKAIALSSFYMYCRELRAIMNIACDTFGKITKESIPFGEGRNSFKIPNSKNKKRKVKLELPLEKLIEQKNKILSHVSGRDTVNKALNYWKASYFGNGANMADVLRWRIGDYDKKNMLIVFDRKKTELTNEENEPVIVFVGDELQEIISREGNKSLDPEEYIFPVLSKGMNSAERKAAVLAFIDFMNKRLKTAAKEMNLEIKLSSGSTRYLASTILDRSGIPNTVIKELLGHTSVDTQSHYVSPYLADLRKNITKILAG